MTTYFRFLKITGVFCLVLLFLRPHYSIGQIVPSTSETNDASDPAQVDSAPADSEPFQIKLSVNEVRLDVVVLDRRGNPVTDLTAEDFEVFQNSAQQNVISSVYIDNQSDAAAELSVSQKDNRNRPPLPAADLKREDTRRTIVLVVDDLSMSFENIHFARRALRNFVEKQMQPGDMAAVLRTGHGNSALQLFLSDKREALARIDAMRLERALPPNFDGSHLYRIYDNQLSTISYCLRAMRDMPGRKTLAVMTANTTLFKPNNSIMMIGANGIPTQMIDFHAEYNDRFSRLADDALRTGVVVNFLNIAGLDSMPNILDIVNMNGRPPQIEHVITGYETRTTTFGDRTTTYQIPIYSEIRLGIGTFPDASGEIQRAIAAMRQAGDNPAMQLQILALGFPNLFAKSINNSPMNALNPLPVKTGGVIIENSNFFLDGIGKETESLMKGYYLVSYVPPPDTFDSGDITADEEIFNKIKVNVKRRNVRVHTRDGFFNRQ